MSDTAPTPKPKKAPKIIRKSKTGRALICNNDVHRLAVRAGVKSFSSAVPAAMRIKIEDDVDRLMRALQGVIDMKKRKTVTRQDVKLAYKRIGQEVLA